MTKYIIGDKNRGLIWYGIKSMYKFSAPGITHEFPVYFNTFEEAKKECLVVQSYYPPNEINMVATEVFFFRPEEQPAEKFERLMTVDKIEKVNTSPFNQSLRSFESNMTKVTSQTILLGKIYLN